MLPENIIDDELYRAGTRSRVRDLALVQAKAGRYGAIGGGVGSVIALLIGFAFMGFDPFHIDSLYSFITNELGQWVLAMAIGLPIAGFFISREAGRLVVFHEWPSILAGIMAGYLSLIAPAIPAGFILFSPYSTDFSDDYGFFPVYLIILSMYGGIPAVVTGIWLGTRLGKIKREYERQPSHTSNFEK